MKKHCLIVILVLRGIIAQAQVTEPVEILPSPTLIAYHMDQWNDDQIILNAVELGYGRYIVTIDEDGEIIDYELWHENTNTCSFLTESKFFRDSDGSLFFYYTKGPDHPVVCKVSISDDLELTTMEFPDPFPIPEGISTDFWWDFEWLPNDDGSVFVSSAYIDGNQSVHVMVRYNELGEITHQCIENTGRATTSLLPPVKGASGCRLVMDDPDAKDVNSECVIFDENLNVVDIKHSIYNQAVGIYRPHYEYFAVHPETDMVYLISDVNFPPFNGNPEIKSDVYMSQFDPDFTQTKYVLGPYTNTEYDQKALCEAIDFHGDDVYICGYMNTYGSDIENLHNFYVAMFDGNMNLKGEIYYHNVTRMVVPYSIFTLPSGGCLVSTGGQDRKTSEQQHAIFKLSEEVILGIEEAHDAGFAVAMVYPNPGGSTFNIRTALQNAYVEIYDLTGKLIYNHEITGNITSINTESWPSGAYVWTVIADDKEVERGKWIKE